MILGIIENEELLISKIKEYRNYFDLLPADIISNVILFKNKKSRTK